MSAGYLSERRVAIIEAGVGRQFAARGAAEAISRHRPAWVVSTGFAGALAIMASGPILYPLAAWWRRRGATTP